MSGRRRYNGVEGGRRSTESYHSKKEAVDLFRPRNRTAVWMPAVPLWEKEFCQQSIGLSWKEFCEAKKITILYPAIEKWDDSAVAEAFHLAKMRYMVKTNGTPFDSAVAEPDPNEFIDVVDWDSYDLGGMDFPNRHGSDSENGENCANGGRETGYLPDLYQEITASEKERYEEEKSEWKERPFGYGRIYFPEINEARTVICKVVDLYTAEPPLTGHWLVDNNENIIGLSVVQSGWTEDEKEEETNPTRHNIDQKNGNMENRACQSAEGGKEKWGNTSGTGLNENKMRAVCYTKVHPMEQEFEASGWGAEFEKEQKEIEATGWGAEFEKDQKEIEPTGWGPEFEKDLKEIEASGWGAEFEKDQKEIEASGWGAEFEEEDQEVTFHTASKNSGGLRYQDEKKCNYELGDCQYQNHWEPFSQFSPWIIVPARRNRRFQTNKKVNGEQLSLNLSHNVEINPASACKQGYFKAPKNAKYWKRQNMVS